jgi:hypothetical protein
MEDLKTYVVIDGMGNKLGTFSCSCAEKEYSKVWDRFGLSKGCEFSLVEDKPMEYGKDASSLECWKKRVDELYVEHKWMCNELNDLWNEWKSDKSCKDDIECEKARKWFSLRDRCELKLREFDLSKIMCSSRIFVDRRYYTDVEPYEVVKVCTDGKMLVREMDAIRVDGNGMSDCQSYVYISNPSNGLVEIRYHKGRKNRGWRTTDNGGSCFHLSAYPYKYYDFSF